MQPIPPVGQRLAIRLLEQHIGFSVSLQAQTKERHKRHECNTDFTGRQHPRTLGAASPLSSPRRSRARKAWRDNKADFGTLRDPAGRRASAATLPEQRIAGERQHRARPLDLFVENLGAASRPQARHRRQAATARSRHPGLRRTHLWLAAGSQTEGAHPSPPRASPARLCSDAAPRGATPLAASGAEGARSGSALPAASSAPWGAPDA